MSKAQISVIGGALMATNDIAQQSKPAIGRPRSLSREDLERVLSLSKAGLGTRSITQELQKAGVDVSRPTVQRALAKKGVYANRTSS
jgi:transposase